MQFLLDADVLVKLGRLGLLERFEKFAKTNAIELGWLGSAFFSLGLHRPDSAKTVRICGRREVVDALIAFCDRHTEVEIDFPELPAESRSMIERLMESRAIHEGEALLFTCAAKTGAHVVTDDIRAIEALVSDERLASIRELLEGRCICLLQIVHSLIREFGFDDIKNTVVGDLASDHAIRAIFGSGSHAREGAVAEALARYLEDRERRGAGVYARLSAERPRRET